MTDTKLCLICRQPMIRKQGCTRHGWANKKVCSDACKAELKRQQGKLSWHHGQDTKHLQSLLCGPLT